MISLIPETKLSAPKKGEKEFDQLYSDNAQYGKVMFWDDRYLRDPEPFEWYYPYKYFRTIINDNIAKEARVLVAGCGNSHMAEDLVLDGFLDVTALDISRVVIDQMKKRCTDFPEIKFITANMTDTNLPANSYDCIIDKAMLDSILCNLKGEEFVQSLVSEVERLLAPHGVYICISYGLPEERLKYLEMYDIDNPLFTPWYTDVLAVEKPLEHELEDLNPDDPTSMYYIYLCKQEPKLAKKKIDRKKQLQKKAKRAAVKAKKGHKNEL